MDALDPKLNEAFDGKVVRKDLLHRIKKGTNVPTFVLEFLLARYCASNDPAEIQAGMEAVLATLQENYVRPDEANAAQSRWREGQAQVHRQGARALRREGKAALGVARELRLAAHRHRREVLPGQRPAAGGRHLGRGGDRPQRHRCRRLRVLRRGPAADPAQPVRFRRLRRGQEGVHARRMDRCRPTVGRP